MLVSCVRVCVSVCLRSCICDGAFVHSCVCAQVCLCMCVCKCVHVRVCFHVIVCMSLMYAKTIVCVVPGTHKGGSIQLRGTAFESDRL